MRNPAFIRPPEYNTAGPMWLDANVAGYFLYRSVRELLAYGAAYAYTIGLTDNNASMIIKW